MYRDRVKTKKNIIPKTLEWEEFELKKLVTCRLLNLFTLATVVFLLIIGFMVWQGSAISPILIGGIITTTVGGICKLLHILMKQSIDKNSSRDNSRDNSSGRFSCK